MKIIKKNKKLFVFFNPQVIIIKQWFWHILSGKIMIQETIVYSIIAVFIGISQVIFSQFRVPE